MNNVWAKRLNFLPTFFTDKVCAFRLVKWPTLSKRRNTQNLSYTNHIHLQSTFHRPRWRKPRSDYRDITVSAKTKKNEKYDSGNQCLPVSRTWAGKWVSGWLLLIMSVKTNSTRSSFQPHIFRPWHDTQANVLILQPCSFSWVLHKEHPLCSKPSSQP